MSRYDDGFDDGYEEGVAQSLEEMEAIRIEKDVSAISDNYDEAFAKGIDYGIRQVGNPVWRWVFLPKLGVKYYEGRDVKLENFEWAYAAVGSVERSIHAPAALKKLTQ